MRQPRALGSAATSVQIVCEKETETRETPQQLVRVSVAAQRIAVVVPISVFSLLGRLPMHCILRIETIIEWIAAAYKPGAEGSNIPGIAILRHLPDGYVSSNEAS
jgi:hypothetical protein